MDIKNIHQSKTIKGILIGICSIILALVIFQAGVFVGYKKALFFHHFDDNYSRNFGGMHGGLGKGFDHDDLISEHGAIGKIVRINLPTFVVASKESLEKVILITKDTIIKRSGDAVPATDLKIDDFAVILGTPNDAGQIEAKFIRLLPSLPTANISTTTQ